MRFAKIFFLNLLLLWGYNTVLYAQNHPSSAFRHPLQIQAPALYNKFRVQGNASDRSNDKEYIREQNLGIEGEWRFLENISLTLKSGYTDHRNTESASYKGQDRLGLGIKSAWEWEDLLVGVGILGFSRHPSAPKTASIQPDFFQLRPYLGVGYKIGDFQMQSEFHFQTETNSQFRENFSEEFRRHYQLGLSLSYGLVDFLSAYLELETRIPYNSKIDTNTRYATAYPGVAFHSESWGRFAVSAGIPVMNERIVDRSVRIQYFYFW